jgi:hypothetical protein
MTLEATIQLAVDACRVTLADYGYHCARTEWYLKNYEANRELIPGAFDFLRPVLNQLYAVYGGEAYSATVHEAWNCSLVLRGLSSAMASGTEREISLCVGARDYLRGFIVRQDQALERLAEHRGILGHSFCLLGNAWIRSVRKPTCGEKVHYYPKPFEFDWSWVVPQEAGADVRRIDAFYKEYRLIVDGHNDFLTGREKYHTNLKERVSLLMRSLDVFLWGGGHEFFHRPLAK